MKNKLFLLALVLGVCTVRAQTFVGYHSGNYAGVNGVFFNPAFAANSRYHWDVNLLQANVSVYNDAASYKLQSFTKGLDADAVLSELYSSNNANALVQADILGPSVLFNINSKTGFALTTRYRLFGNLRQIDGSLLQAIKGEDALPSFNISNNNMQIATTGWMEAGVTWANVLYNKDKHFLKGGISLKYLGGITNTSASTRNLQANISHDMIKDSYFAGAASGTIHLQSGGAAINDFSLANLTKFEGTGVGFDAGLTYEWRPHSDQYKTATGYDRSVNMYKIRASMALMDMGSIRFTPDADRSGNYTVGITGSDQFDLGELNTDVDNIKEALDANPAFFTPAAPGNSKYKVSLPARWMAEVDYHFNKGFYLNVTSNLSLAKNQDVYQMSTVNSVIVTPRIEASFIGIYLPVQVNSMTGFDAGAALRLGKLVVGSSNILTAIAGSKMVNLYIGVRLLGSKIK